MSPNVEIDLSALESEIQSLTPEQIREQLVGLRTKQRVNQKKYHNADKAKAYMAKRAAKQKAMVEWAKTQPATDGKSETLYAQILAEAAEKADAILGAEAADVAETVEA